MKTVKSNKTEMLLCLIMLIGCQHVRLSYQDTFVDPEKRLPLVDQAVENLNYFKNEFSITYGYKVEFGQIQISGELIWDKSIVMNFNHLNSFLLNIHFVDGDGKIISTTPLINAGFLNRLEPISFSKKIDLPGQTKFYRFSYSGHFRSPDDSDIPLMSTDWSFWENP